MNSKSILLLGASSDMARSLAVAYAKEKYTLLLAGRSTEDLDRMVSDLSIRYGVTVKGFLFDAANTASHEEFTQSLGVLPDIVICVFGYLGEQQVAEKNWKEAERIIQTNYTGAVSILNIFANKMEERKAGTIVGISSVAGDRGRQSNYIYGSAKAGFTAYLSGMRNRLVKSGVHVVTVKPGFVATKMTDGLKLPKPVTANPDQVAKAIVGAVNKKKNVIYVLFMWRYIMTIITLIPEFVFKKMKL